MSETIEKKKALYLVSVYDKKANLFGSLCAVRTVEVGIRMFFDLVNDKSQIYGVHPEDFDLYVLSEFDDENGTFVFSNYPQKVASGLMIASALKEKESANV